MLVRYRAKTGHSLAGGNPSDRKHTLYMVRTAQGVILLHLTVGYIAWNIFSSKSKIVIHLRAELGA